MTYGGSNPPLCTTHFHLWQGVDVDLSPAGSGRMIVALVVIGLLALSAWSTMDAGKYRDLTFVLLGLAGFRVVLDRLRRR